MILALIIWAVIIIFIAINVAPGFLTAFIGFGSAILAIYGAIYYLAEKIRDRRK